jgi:hypothetical protein
VFTLAVDKVMSLWVMTCRHIIVVAFAPSNRVIRSLSNCHAWYAWVYIPTRASPCRGEVSHICYQYPGAERMDAGSRLGHGAQGAVPDEPQ